MFDANTVTLTVPCFEQSGYLYTNIQVAGFHFVMMKVHLKKIVTAKRKDSVNEESTRQEEDRLQTRKSIRSKNK